MNSSGGLLDPLSALCDHLAHLRGSLRLAIDIHWWALLILMVFNVAECLKNSFQARLIDCVVLVLRAVERVLLPVGSFLFDDRPYARLECSALGERLGRRRRWGRQEFFGKRVRDTQECGKKLGRR